MVPYDVILPYVDDLEHTWILASLSSDVTEESNALAAYLDFLVLAGWTEEQFHEETFRRVNMGWDIFTQPPRGTHPMLVFDDTGIPPWRIHVSPFLH